MSTGTPSQTLHRSMKSSYSRVTLADVAKDAGVHKGTASRALRGLPGVDPATRARVSASAIRLEYSASAIATALATGRSQTIGLVLPTLRWWYFCEVAAGASEVLVGAGYRVELINLDVDSDFLEVDGTAFHRLMNQLGASDSRDALLFAGTIARPGDARRGPSATVPAAVVGNSMTHVSGVFVDNRLGGRLVAQHLADLGHTTVAVMAGQMPAKTDVHVWSDRTAGFREVFSEAVVITPGDCHAVDGQRAMTALLESGRPLPTAVFCHTDDMAFGAMAALRRAGVRCPHDISIAGFDDHPMSQYWGLTTVTQHAHQQGLRSAAALLDAMHIQPMTPAFAVLESLRVRLVVRETTAEPSGPDNGTSTFRLKARPNR